MSVEFRFEQTERNVIRLLIEDPTAALTLAGEIGVTPRTVERAFANLQKKLREKGSKPLTDFGLFERRTNEPESKTLT